MREIRGARRLPGSSFFLWVLAFCVVVSPRLRPVSAAPSGFSDPPAPPPLPWPVDAPIVASEEVGVLPGGGTLTAAGDYQYTLPIEVPDGRAGMAPDVALRYSSRGGGTALSVTGVGWSLDYGGSEIGRCAKTFLVDGESDAPDHAGDDALCLDGERLVQVNAVPPMSEGAEYRTHRDRFVRVVAHGGGGESAGGFEVWDKDGTVRVYTPIFAKRLLSGVIAPKPLGEPDTSAPPVDVAAVWVLSSERDRAGNAVLFKYQVEPADAPPHALEYRIASIEYTATMGEQGKVVEAPRRRVVFEYSRLGSGPTRPFTTRAACGAPSRAGSRASSSTRRIRRSRT